MIKVYIFLISDSIKKEQTHQLIKSLGIEKNPLHPLYEMKTFFRVYFFYAGKGAYLYFELLKMRI